MKGRINRFSTSSPRPEKRGESRNKAKTNRYTGMKKDVHKKVPKRNTPGTDRNPPWAYTTRRREIRIPAAAIVRRNARM
jgi:hypothetical protein